eukprot:scaffold10022_cov21-Cyclotella_meneghiniana.AAC.1
MIGATIADNTDGTLYTDQTGAFPVVSYKGNKIMFVAYEYRSNAIIAKPIRSNSDESLVAAFKEVYEYLSDKGFKPKLNLVNPDDHRVNAAERAIQTWKNHFLAGLNTIDPNCPVQLWDEFVNQGMITLNLLRASRVNPKLSAYAQLEGQFNFDRTPMAPVGTKSLIFLDPNKRRSYQNHALDAWYVGPAMNHYRNYRFWLPDTHGFRTGSTAKFFPAHCKMPAIEPGDTIRLAAQDLIQAIQNRNKHAPIDLMPKHTEALRQLVEIFKDTTAAGEVQSTPAPRVSAPSSSIDATNPERLRNQPRIHSRVTRRNTPMPTVMEETFEAEELENESTANKENENPNNNSTLPRVQAAPR